MKMHNPDFKSTIAERYVNEVMSRIPLPIPGRQEFEDDLRSHIKSALEAGERPNDIISSMGFPDEVALSFIAQKKLNYGYFSQRLGAFLIDLMFLVTAFGLLFSAGSALQPHDSQYGSLAGIIVFILQFIFTMMIFSLFIYFPVAEGRFGQTIGKKAMNLWVLKENGLPIGYKEAIIRRIPFYFKIWWLDILFILFTGKRQRAFDMIAKTVVVRFQDKGFIRKNIQKEVGEKS
jgi:uncharacterized RDD family membrane protein YckC